MKKIAIIFLLMNIFIFANSQEAIEVDMTSHIEIIETFLFFIKNQQFDDCVKLFDWDVIEYDFKQFSTFFISIQPISDSLVFPKIESFSKITRQANVIKQIETLISNILLPEEYYNFLEGKSYPWPIINSDTFTEDIIIDFLSYFDFTRLKNLEILKIELVEPRLQFTPRNRNAIKEIGKIYGFSEAVDYYIYYSFEGNNYIGEITLCKYSERWYIHHLTSYLGNILKGRVRKIY